MNRTMLLVRSNIRRTKGQTAAIIVLVLISSVLMNLWLMLAMDYKKNFDRSHEKLNDGHVTIAAYTDNEAFREFLNDILENDGEVTGFSVSDALEMPGSLAYGGGEIMSAFVFLEKEAALSRDVGRFEITEEGGLQSGIYLSMIYGMGDQYCVGDQIELTIGSETFQYPICGFFNNTMAGTHNCGMLSFLLTKDQFQELSENGSAMRATFVSVRIRDKMKSEEAEASLNDRISEEFSDVLWLSNHYGMVTTSRYISQMICAGIMSAMAFFVLLIGVVVISSNVMNDIQENMQNLGALKAMGYTGRQLIFSLIMQFSGVCVVTAAFGVGLSYCIFPMINSMMIAQTGIPYQMRFLLLPCLITLGLIFVIVALAVWLSAKKMKKIEPITAIRQGVTTHNFKKNKVALDKTCLPLHAALAMKTACSRVKQNITVGVTMLVLSLILVFSGVMFENMIINMQPFIDLIAGEVADSCINVNRSREDEFLAAMHGDSRVEKLYEYTAAVALQHTGGTSLIATISDDFSKLNNQSIIIEGRFPIYDNEVAVGAKYAKENDLKVGDEILLKTEGNEESYLITGYVQTTNQLGKDCAITREGYERIGSSQDVSYYLNLTDDTDIDDFNAGVCEQFGRDINTTLNIMSVIEGSGSVYVSLMTIIVTAILIVSGIVVVFVMYLLVRTLLNSKKRDYGILKALGYTTRQLILQTAFSFMPPIILFTLVGMVICTQIINPLLAVFLSGLGIVKCMFTVPPLFIIIAGAALILFAFAAACLMSLRIKKIAPRTLISGE